MRRESDIRHGTPRWIKAIITCAFLAILLVAALDGTLWYVDTAYSKIPDHGNRAEVERVLRLFRETKVSAADIPIGWQEGVERIPGYEVYRYDYLGCPLFAIHVVYDEHRRAKSIIPTYE